MMSPIAVVLLSHVQAVCPNTRATVLDLGVTPTEMPNATWTLHGNPCRERPLLRLTGTVEGTVVHSITIRPHLELEKRGLIAANTAHQGQPLSVVEGWVPYHQPALRIHGKLRARRDLEAGQPLGPLDADPIPDAAKGSKVQIVLRRGGIVLSTEGRLLADTQLQHPTRAMNPNTGAVLRGVLIDPETVEIR